MEAEQRHRKKAPEGITESDTGCGGIPGALAKIRLSGYVQTQWRVAEVTGAPYPVGDFSGGAFPADAGNLFTIRRGRLKVTYENGLTQLVLQLDATQSGVSTKDAYLSLTDPWLRSFSLRMGMFERPFGYEVSHSSGLRESPERSRLFQTLFPGERDLGAGVFFAPPDGPLSRFGAELGIFNGSGPSASDYDSYKDLIGRLGWRMPLEGTGMELGLGISGYFGKVRNSTKYLFRTATLPGGLAGYTVDSTASNEGRGAVRTYMGVDAQFSLDIPSLGSAVLRGEYIAGKQPGTASTSLSSSSQPAGGLYKRKFAGWYAVYVQSIGPDNQAVLKYDVYDPNTNAASGDFTPSHTGGATGLAAPDITFRTLGLGFIHRWDENIKFVLYYEIIRNEELSSLAGSASPLLPYASDLRDDVFTFRIQYRF